MMNEVSIKNSFNGVEGSTIIIDNPELIEENNDLKQIVELLFGNNYEEFLKKQKNNTALIIYLNELLNGKTLFETVEILKQEKEKRDKLFSEVEKLKDRATNEDFKHVLDQAEDALAAFKYEEFHQLIENYRKNGHLKGKVKEFAKTYFIQAEELYNRFKYQDAIKYYHEAKYYDKENPIYANNLGGAYYCKGDYDQAITYYNKALEIALKTIGEIHPRTATYYNNLGLAYESKGDYDQAIAYHTKALELALKIIGETHPRTALYYSNLGSTYQSKGNHDQVSTYYQKALKLALKTIGETHPSIAKYYNNLGLVYEKKGDFEQAITNHTKALEIDLKTIGETHPDTATCYNNLGSAYYKKGDYDQAITFIKKSHRIFQQTSGDNHFNIKSNYMI